MKPSDMTCPDAMDELLWTMIDKGYQWNLKATRAPGEPTDQWTIVMQSGRLWRTHHEDVPSGAGLPFERVLKHVRDGSKALKAEELKCKHEGIMEIAKTWAAFIVGVDEAELPPLSRREERRLNQLKERKGTQS